MWSFPGKLQWQYSAFPLQSDLETLGRTGNIKLEIGGVCKTQVKNE